MTTHYDNKKRATFMLRQELAAKPMSVEEMHLKVLTEFGFGRKFVMEFLELHMGALSEEGGVFTWKA
jgi:hypothetical protein